MLTVQCPHCTNTMQLPADLVGKEVGCRACARSFVARPTGTLAASEKEDTVPAEGWQRVRLGLTLILVCTVLALAVAPLAWIRLSLLIETIRGQESARAPLAILTLLLAAAALVIAASQRWAMLAAKAKRCFGDQRSRVSPKKHS